MPPHRVVILGGGFGGLHAAKSLGRADVDVTLVDQRNFHLFQPLLYQVATGGLSPADIAAPLRSVLKRQRNTSVVQQRALDIDVEAREVVLEQMRLPFDTLIVATGVRHHYFGHDEWEAHAPGLKTVEDATAIRSKLLRGFEMADTATDASTRRRHLTFAIIGGGPTGVELAGAIGELAHHTLPREFHRIDTASARVVLLEGAGRILLDYPESLSSHATEALTALGVEVATDSLVTHVDERGVVIDRAGEEQRIDAGCVLWAAGVKASLLGRVLAKRAGAKVDSAGRVEVTSELTIPGHRNLFVIGDLARFVDQRSGKPLAGVAPVAMQQGAFVARVIVGRLSGEPSLAFSYRDRGSMAVIGRARAVARLARWNVRGYPAWLLWLFVHLLHLVEFESRLIVLIQWAWSYFTRNRRARLITGTSRYPPVDGLAEVREEK